MDAIIRCSELDDCGGAGAMSRICDSGTAEELLALLYAEERLLSAGEGSLNAGSRRLCMLALSRLVAIWKAC